MKNLEMITRPIEIGELNDILASHQDFKICKHCDRMYFRTYHFKGNFEKQIYCSRSCTSRANHVKRRDGGFFQIRLNKMIKARAGNKEIFLKNVPFARRIKELRLRKGLTPHAAALLAGMDKDAVRKIEKGVYKPEPKSIERLANFFNVTVDFLLKEEEQPEPIMTQKQDNELPNPQNPAEVPQDSPVKEDSANQNRLLSHIIESLRKCDGSPDAIAKSFNQAVKEHEEQEKSVKVLIDQKKVLDDAILACSQLSASLGELIKG